MLEQFGFTDAEESVYLHLVEAPELAEDELASAVPVTTAGIRPVLDRLISAGLVNRQAGRPVRKVCRMRFRRNG